ncbi:MAG: hydroxyacylglutathione hydrolase [Methylotenera sp.]|nr:hydroxyacylglutathione hydrolase [Methylotenera sp.]
MIESMQHKLQIIPIPAFKDNYIWLLHNGTKAVIVDPGDAAPVIATLNQLSLSLSAILVTHHHHDHIGGVSTLLKHYSNAAIYAPRYENYNFKHHPVSEPNTVSLPEFGLDFSVIDLPGHTLGHIAYYSPDILFCGDTLFGAGCGRLFEGTPEQMFNSLKKLADLPPTTKVYCTHEYTLHNINFALFLEPNNTDLLQRKYDTEKLRHASEPSLPSTLILELATNPFLRCTNPEILLSLQLGNIPPLEVFKTIREMRNHY